MLLVLAAARTIKQEEARLKFSSLLRLPQFQKAHSETVDMQIQEQAERLDTGSVLVVVVLVILEAAQVVQEGKRAAENLIVAA